MSAILMNVVIKGMDQETAIKMQEEINAITGRKGSLGLNEIGMPVSVGVELNAHIQGVLRNMGKMNDSAEKQGRTNDRSKAVIAKFEEIVSNYI